jgi:hypothetical protein
LEDDDEDEMNTKKKSFIKQPKQDKDNVIKRIPNDVKSTEAEREKGLKPELNKTYDRNEENDETGDKTRKSIDQMLQIIADNNSTASSPNLVG